MCAFATNMHAENIRDRRPNGIKTSTHTQTKKISVVLITLFFAIVVQVALVRSEDGVVASRMPLSKMTPLMHGALGVHLVNGNVLILID